jgi:hypothetical protein
VGEYAGTKDTLLESLRAHAGGSTSSVRVRFALVAYTGTLSRNGTDLEMAPRIALAPGLFAMCGAELSSLSILVWGNIVVVLGTRHTFEVV